MSNIIVRSGVQASRMRLYANMPEARLADLIAIMSQIEAVLQGWGGVERLASVVDELLVALVDPRNPGTANRARAAMVLEARGIHGVDPELLGDIIEKVPSSRSVVRGSIIGAVMNGETDIWGRDFSDELYQVSRLTYRNPFELIIATVVPVVLALTWLIQKCQAIKQAHLETRKTILEIEALEEDARNRRIDRETHLREAAYRDSLDSGRDSSPVHAALRAALVVRLEVENVEPVLLRLEGMESALEQLPHTLSIEAVDEE